MDLRLTAIKAGEDARETIVVVFGPIGWLRGWEARCCRHGQRREASTQGATGQADKGSSAGCYRPASRS